MTEYAFEKGKHNAKPNQSICPRFGVRGFTGRFKLDLSCWFGKDEWKGDSDYYDWNFKVMGISSYFSANNRTSAIIAARPIDEPGKFIVTGYTNDGKGRFRTGQHTEAIGVLVVEAEQEVEVDVRLSKGNFFRPDRVQYELKTDANSIYIEHQFRIPFHRIFREIGSWFGGADSNNNGIGGVPHKDMHYQAQMKVK